LNKQKRGLSAKFNPSKKSGLLNQQAGFFAFIHLCRKITIFNLIFKYNNTIT